MHERSVYLEVAMNAAIKAGKFLLARFNENHAPIYKSKSDIGLSIDKESENIILKHIQTSFPEHSICSEEVGCIENSSEYKWFIDPLDGTNNYYVGIPYFAVSVALANDGKTIVGVVYDPITDRLFVAEKGKGAYLNGNKILLKSLNSTNYNVISFIKGHSKLEISNKTASELQTVISNHFSRTLTMWAPSLDWCNLASGKIDALVSFESEFEDMVAGMLIAEEAGIEVCGFDGMEYNLRQNKIAASQNNLKENLVKLLLPFSN